MTVKVALHAQEVIAFQPAALQKDGSISHAGTPGLGERRFSSPRSEGGRRPGELKAEYEEAFVRNATLSTSPLKKGNSL